MTSSMVVRSARSQRSTAASTRLNSDGRLASGGGNAPWTLSAVAKYNWISLASSLGGRLKNRPAVPEDPELEHVDARGDPVLHPVGAEEAHRVFRTHGDRGGNLALLEPPADLVAEDGAGVRRPPGLLP